MSMIILRTNAFAICVTIALLCIGSDLTAATNLVTAIQGKKVLESQLNVVAKQTSVTLWGVQFDLAQNDTPYGIARIGVFKSVDEARKVLDDRLMNTSVGPSRKFVNLIGDKTYGWGGRILFVRDNVLVDLQLPESKVEEGAHRIDQVLSVGDGSDIKRGADVDVLRIEDVESLSPSDWVAHTSRIVPGYTAIVDKSGTGNTSIDSADYVCFATEGCVMAEPMKCDKSLLLAKMDAAKAKDQKDKTLSPEAKRKQAEEAMTTLQDKASSAYHRNKAIIALGNSGDVSAIPTLLTELERTSAPVVKQNTITALGRLRAKQAVPYLLNILDAPLAGNVSDDGEWEAIFRREAVKALGNIGDSSALATLRKVMDASHEYQSVRDATKSAIRMIEKLQRW